MSVRKRLYAIFALALASLLIISVLAGIQLQRLKSGQKVNSEISYFSREVLNLRSILQEGLSDQSDSLLKKGMELSKTLENELEAKIEKSSYIKTELEEILRGIKTYAKDFEQERLLVKKQKDLLSELDGYTENVIQEGSKIAAVKKKVSSDIFIPFLSARAFEKEYLRLKRKDTYESWEAYISYSEMLFNDLGSTELISALKNYQEGFKKIVNLVKEQENLKQEIATLNGKVSVLAIESQNNIQEKVESQIQEVFLVLVVSTLLFFVIGLVFISKLVNKITHSLDQAVKTSINLSEGKLEEQFDSAILSSDDEFGKMAKSLKETTEKLKVILSEIKNNSEEISQISEMNNSLATDLSEGTTEQAASSEEVSSSIEEMNANIEQNSHNSKYAEKISTEVNTKLRGISVQMVQIVEAVNSINSKIGIIDDISRQTNLLALNAAVEAARAGEHGKGFAVVAVEVRKLAEGTRESASQIMKTIIDCKKQVNDMAQAVQNVLPEVEKNTFLIREISGAGNEQSIGAHQINSAVQQLNSITIKNAAIAEDLSSNTGELNKRILELNRSISFFTV